MFLLRKNCSISYRKRGQILKIIPGQKNKKKKTRVFETAELSNSGQRLLL